MKNLLHKWHWFWFKRHMKWLLIDERKKVYNQIWESFNEFLLKDIEQIAYVDKPYTEDDMIELVKKVEEECYYRR